MTANQVQINTDVKWQFSKDNEWIDHKPEVCAYIEEKLQAHIKQKNRRALAISLTPLSKQFSECKGYQIIISLNVLHDPVIMIKAIQCPLNRKLKNYTKYIKNCQRIPNMDAPLPWNFDTYQCKLNWQFKNSNVEWEEYSPEVSKQIELAFNNHMPYVMLTVGKFREPKNRNVFRIRFFQHSIPIDCEQQNLLRPHSNTPVRYTAIGDSNENKQEDEPVVKSVTNKVYELHVLYKRFYRPLGMQFWTQKRMMRDAMMCSICFTEFQEENFLEYHVSQMLNKQSLSQIEINKLKRQQSLKRNTNNNDSDSDSEEEVVLHDEYGQINPDIIAIQLSNCIGAHYFHAGCIVQWLDMKKQCAVCKKQYGYTTGTMPKGTMRTRIDRKQHVAGYKGCGRIEITFEFPNGTQGSEHPNPGVKYDGDFRKVYLPYNRNGRELLEMIKIAFRRRLIFSVGRSLTLQQDNKIVWSDIHFKSSPYGGIANHGWPDKTYFQRVRDELREKGITMDDIPTIGR